LLRKPKWQNDPLKKQQRQGDDFYFSRTTNHAAKESAVRGVISGLVEAGRHQIQTAMKLTKIFVERNPNASS